MEHEEMRRRAVSARAARVGTFDERGHIHLVPIVFVIEGDTLYSSTDEKPRAKRLRNLQRDPRVSVVIDVYDEEWSKVWWVRLVGRGRAVEEGPEFERARRLLCEKYPQFEGDPGGGPIMAVDVDEWSGWAYSA
jgi:PPOX class probable F420-dependent enzyme